MTSVRTYSMEKDRAIKEIQSGIREVERRVAAGITELQEGEKGVERRMAAGITELIAEREVFERRVTVDVNQKQEDADRFAVDFWEGD